MLSDKYLQLSFILHLIMAVLFFIVSQYNTPVPKIQITLVPSISQNKNPEKKLVKQATKSPTVKKTKTKPKVVKKTAKPNPIKPRKPVITKMFSHKSPSLPKEKQKKKITKTKQTNIAKTSTEEHTVIDLNPKKSVPQKKEKRILPTIKKDILAFLDYENNKPLKIEKDLVLPDTEIPKDLTELSMNDLDKKALSQRLSNCVSTLPQIRENDEELFLRFKVNKNAIVENIDIIRNNTIISDADLSTLERRVIAIFQNTECSKLLLPKNQYQIWHEFSVKLKLQGFFNE